MKVSTVVQMGTFNIPVILIEEFISWDDGYESVIETLILETLENFRFTICRNDIIIYRSIEEEKEVIYTIPASKKVIEACNSFCCVFCEIHYFVYDVTTKKSKESVFFGVELSSHEKAKVRQLNKPKFCVRVKETNEPVSFYKRRVENV